MIKKEQTVKKQAAHAVSVGDSGVPEIGFDITSEIESKLIGIEGTRTYKKMALGDSQITMLLRTIKTPISSADWEIISSSDKPEHSTHQEFIKDYFFNIDGLKPTWTKTLNSILSFLQYGFSVFEVVWREWEWRNNIYMVPDLQFRAQSSVVSINQDEQYVEQQKSKGDTTNIPFEFLTFFILDQEGNDMRGTSLIRGAYKDWINREEAELLDTVGVRKMALGTPIVKYPKSLSKAHPDFKSLEEALMALGTMASPYFMLPNIYEFDIVEGKYNAASVNIKIQRHNVQMSKSVLAQFLELGMQGKSGSYSLGDTQSQLLLNSLKYIVELIQEPLNRLIETIIIHNFGKQESYPRVFGMNINREAVQKLIDNAIALKAAGAVEFTQRDEDFLRTKADLPELTLEEKKERSEKKDKQDKEFTNSTAKQIPFQEDEDLGMEEDMENSMTNAAWEYRQGCRNHIECGCGEEIDKQFRRNIKFAEPTQAAVLERKRLYWKNRQEFIKKEIPNLRSYMQANLVLMKDKLLADVANVLSKGTIATRGLKNVQVSGINKYIIGLQRKLAYLVNNGWQASKQDAKPHMGAKKFAEMPDFDPKKLTPELQVYVINKTDAIIESQTVELRARVVFTVQNEIDDGLSTAQAIASASSKSDKYITGNTVRAAADNVVNDGWNVGQLDFGKVPEVSSVIVAYEFINLNPKTNICKVLSKGHYYTPGGAAYSWVRTPLHFGCNSFLMPRYSDEAKVKIDNYIPSPSIQKEKTL